MKPSRTFTFAAIAGFVFFSASCSNSLDALENDHPCTKIENSQGIEILCIKTEDSEISIANNSGQIVYYLVIEQRTLALIDIDPDYTTWLSMEVDETATIPYTDIIGYDDSATEAWITWVLGEDETGGSITIEL